MREIDSIDPQFKQVNRETLRGWVVWYWIEGQGLVKYNSEEHDWVDLPKIGVQYLYRLYDTYKEQVAGCDFYCPYQLMNMQDIRPFIKFGLYLDDELYSREVAAIVTTDPINY